MLAQNFIVIFLFLFSSSHPHLKTTLLCSAGWLGAQRNPLASASPMLGLKVYAPIPGGNLVLKGKFSR